MEKTKILEKMKKKDQAKEFLWLELSTLAKLAKKKQKDIAEETGISKSTVGTFLSGKNNIHSDSLMEILSYFGIDLISIVKERIQDMGKGEERKGITRGEAFEECLRSLNGSQGELALNTICNILKDSTHNKEELVKFIKADSVGQYQKIANKIIQS